MTKIRTHILLVLIWVQTVSKGYHQMTKVTARKERANRHCRKLYFLWTPLVWIFFLTSNVFIRTLVNETFFLSTQNICSNWWVRKYLQFYAKKFCLSKPVFIFYSDSTFSKPKHHKGISDRMASYKPNTDDQNDEIKQWVSVVTNYSSQYDDSR